MLNKKGFTLVELLAVIVLVALVATIGSVSITKVKKQMDKKMFETKLDLVLQAAKDYGEDKSVKSNDSSKQVNVNDLIISGNYETEETVVGYINSDNYYYDSTNTNKCKGFTTGTGSNVKYFCYTLINDEGKDMHDLTVKISKENNRYKACIKKNFIFPGDITSTDLSSIYTNFKNWC